MSWQPVVVIASHQRQKITETLIEKVLKSHDSVKVVLVVSLIEEFNHFKNLNYDRLALAIFPNKPLGSKWQQAVNIAKKIKANPVIILGSDDQLNPEFIDNVINLLNEGYHFITFRRYNILHQGILYTYDYKPEMGLGSGRVYTAEILNAFKWHLFESSKNKHLDDLGYKQVMRCNKKFLVVENEDYGLSITSIKGDWEMLNPFEPDNSNIKLVKRVSCAE